MHDGTIQGTGETATRAAASDVRGLIRSTAHRVTDEDIGLPDEGGLGSFGNATGWLNSEPLTPEGLRGRVVLVDFWTYTCVNWLRTLPYLRAWSAKYATAGLTVVGIHTPEFGFEHNVVNVTREAGRLGVEYPVAIDNDYGIWRAYANHFWPAIYLGDVAGRIRYHHFGEGEYAMTEMVIQRLLIDAGAVGVDRDLVMVEPRGLEVAADWRTLQSPETYLGYRQATGFEQESVSSFDESDVYELPARLYLNAWALSGDWTVAGHAGILNQAGGRIAFQFHARDVNLVMGPSSPGISVRYRTFLDGRPVGDSHGTDVDPDGSAKVDTPRTYQVVRQRGPVDERRFEIEFLDPGIEAYCFTFG
jgi:thiol-disulfide isomerase/thioredoxin